MKSRGSRVYVLLAIMAVIMFFAINIDMTVDKTSESIEESINNVKEENNIIDNDTETITEETTETTTLLVLTPEEESQVESFYKNTVFVGDSIMSGFSTYAASNADAPEFVQNLIFLAAKSYGIDAAISGEKLMYKGESRTLVENIELINPDKIFINLGVNELDGVSAEKVGEKYGTLISQIREAAPEAGIYILGATYFVEGKETETYNNGGIRAFNEYIKEHCTEWVATYVDLPSKLSNKDGYLPAEFSIDGRIHHNDNAYRLWVELLEETALNK